MQIVRYIFSYSIVVVVVVSIASGYYYRETLFPNLFTQAGLSLTAADTTTEKGSVSEKPISVGQQVPVTVPPDTVMPITEVPVTPELLVTPLQASQPQISQIEQTADTGQTNIASKKLQGAQIASQHMVDNEAATATTERVSGTDSAAHPGQLEPHIEVVDQPVMPTMPMQQQSVPPATSPLSRADSGLEPRSQALQSGETNKWDIETIMKARQAYWTGDYVLSEQAYQQLIDRHPDQAELQGEVGNVYYAQGNWASAAAAYAQVVRHLYRTGRIAQADYMLQIVTSLDRDLGKQLLREKENSSVQQ